MRLGWQYVRESKRTKDAIVRTAAFFLNSTALLASASAEFTTPPPWLAF